MKPPGSPGTAHPRRALPSAAAVFLLLTRSVVAGIALRPFGIDNAHTCKPDRYSPVWIPFPAGLEKYSDYRTERDGTVCLLNPDTFAQPGTGAYTQSHSVRSVVTWNKTGSDKT